MRLAICDRSAEDRRALSAALDHAFARHSVSCFVEQYDEATDLLCDVRDGAAFEVILLELDDENGLHTARCLREQHYSGDIVFVSASADFAVDGYEVGACGYLLKPYRSERLWRLVDQRLARSARPQCLTVCHYRTVVRIPYHEILFIESCNTHCVIHRRDSEPLKVYRRLDDLEKELRDPRFLRCHQSYLVNMDHIVGVSTHFTMDGGETVAIRQRELKRLRECYLDYAKRFDKDR